MRIDTSDVLITGATPEPYTVHDQPVAFTKDYRGGGRFHGQFAKGAGLQWQADDPKLFDWKSALDFTKPVTPDELNLFYGTSVWEALSADGVAELRRDMLSEQLSQFLHGEQGGLKVTSQLIAAIEDINGQMAAGLQVGDEARHVEFMRLALARVGKAYPVNTSLQDLIDQAMREPAPHLKFISIQLLIEGLALASFGTIRRALQASAVAGGGDALLESGLAYVIRDESRHVALGMDMLKDMLGRLTPAERLRASEFVYDGFRLMRERLLPRFVCEERGIDPDAFYVQAASASLAGYHSALIKGVLPKALVLGLVPDKLRDRYAQEFGVDWARVGKSAASLVESV